MNEIKIEDLYGAKVIGMRKEYYLTTGPGESFCDDDEPAEGVRFIIFVNKERISGTYKWNEKYSIMLEDSFGWCGSGYTTASWGYMGICRVDDNIGPITHKPKDRNLTLKPSESSMDRLYADEDVSTNIFAVSFDGDDQYYPMGGIFIDESLFEKLPRAMDSRPRYIFYGGSGLGKSTVALLTSGKTVYETDSSKTLPEVIWEDIVVLGNKYNFSKEEVKEHLSSQDNVIFVEFSKEEEDEQIKGT